jgi:hypothetical protein
MDNALSFILVGGALAILAVTIAGAADARRARLRERDMDPYALSPLVHPAPDANQRLDTAIARLREAYDSTPSPALRDLAARKINEAHATLITRLADDARDGHGSVRARMQRVGR